jgi:hypothetical protein
VSRLLVTGLLACGLSAHADDVRQDHPVAHAANTRDVNCPPSVTTAWLWT